MTPHERAAARWAAVTATLSGLAASGLIRGWFPVTGSAIVVDLCEGQNLVLASLPKAETFASALELAARLHAQLWWRPCE